MKLCKNVLETFLEKGHFCAQRDIKFEFSNLKTLNIIKLFFFDRFSPKSDFETKTANEVNYVKSVVNTNLIICCSNT